MVYSAAQIAVATESFAFWKASGLPWVSRIGMLAQEDGESSFDPKAIGDKGAAFGPFQPHQDRVDEIEKGSGFDVKTGSHLDQLIGAYWEMKVGWYKHVWPLLMAASTLEEAVTIGVQKFEQSANQAADIARRTALASDLATLFPQPKTGV